MKLTRALSSWVPARWSFTVALLQWQYSHFPNDWTETEGLKNVPRSTSSLGSKLSLYPQFLDKGDHYAETAEILRASVLCSPLGPHRGGGEDPPPVSRFKQPTMTHLWQDGGWVLGYVVKGEHIFSKNAGQERGSQLLQEKQNMLGVQGSLTEMWRMWVRESLNLKVV